MLNNGERIVDAQLSRHRERVGEEHAQWRRRKLAEIDEAEHEARLHEQQAKRLRTQAEAIKRQLDLV